MFLVAVTVTAVPGLYVAVAGVMVPPAVGLTVVVKVYAVQLPNEIVSVVSVVPTTTLPVIAVELLLQVADAEIVPLQAAAPVQSNVFAMLVLAVQVTPLGGVNVMPDTVPPPDDVTVTVVTVRPAEALTTISPAGDATLALLTVINPGLVA